MQYANIEDEDEGFLMEDIEEYYNSDADSDSESVRSNKYSIILCLIIRRE